MTELQRTIAKEATFTGVGLHTGRTTHLTFHPAPEDHGIVFVRTDLEGSPEIRVCPENARTDIDALRRTVLRCGNAEVHTVEHVLSAVSGLGIDALRIEVDGQELPEPEAGSARPWVDVLREAGMKELTAPKRYFVIEKPIALDDGAARIVGLPYDGFRISFTIVYDNPVVGTQHIEVDIDPDRFAEEIAPARTFALYEDIEALKKAGLIQGGTLNNAVVVKGDEILNEEGLRFADEFVRHKVLDLLGDLAVLGRPVRGHITSVRSGHRSNVAFVQKAHDTANGVERFDTILGQTHFDINAITKIMPHRYPFLLVDRIIHLVERERVVGIKNVTINEPFFEGHFPGHPIMPAVLILEAMAQVGGVLLLNTVDDPDSKLVYFMGIDKAKFRRPVLPGDQLVMDLELVRLKRRICIMNAKGYVRGQLVAEAELSSTIVDR
ncbi:MAG: bifunctional UDP-3-O-[3-hydroxymyristoyl] N-acetylglucosamine deacetylase/3-hydroxyacyl-ACP dehydratase [Candidatus Eisenbacteria bacterium]